MRKTINLCIHGHFYQPPRENPWTGEIENQKSAAPFHDWNERIFSECYEPNSSAVVIDQNSGQKNHLCNYLYLSYNFGPTLLEWLKKKHTDVYRSIIESATLSKTLHNGHSNSIAQIYNHVIMPLANEKDKITQVKWGIEFYEYHFKEKPEGMWLSETACNYKTIDILISEGIRFTILDTSQAKAFRKTGTESWTNTSEGFNPFISYKCFSQTNPEKYIVIYFFDGPLSRSIAFEDTITSSYKLFERIENIGENITFDNHLLSIAVDGETFGHHKKHAEKTLAHFFSVLAPEHNIRIMNYGEHLAMHPPEYEVVLNEGPFGEGTSWSCPHGVARWKDDCGCSRGDWHQRWRKPLRDTLDWLRDNLIIIFEREGSKFLKDIWVARNNYIKLICDNSEETRQDFFTQHALRKLSPEEQQKCRDLLEMQRYTMLMYTSCGWFFSEISGLETVKILEYTRRAIELSRSFSDIDFEIEFKNRLALAESNLSEFKNGKTIYEKLVVHND